jgi:arylsulfatase A-like enzyme
MGTDLFPTLLEVAGLALPEERVLDGESLEPLFAGRGSLARDAVFWHLRARLEAWRQAVGAPVPSELNPEYAAD